MFDRWIKMIYVRLYSLYEWPRAILPACVCVHIYMRESVLLLLELIDTKSIRERLHSANQYHFVRRFGPRGRRPTLMTWSWVLSGSFVLSPWKPNSFSCSSSSEARCCFIQKYPYIFSIYFIHFFIAINIYLILFIIIILILMLTFPV